MEELALKFSLHTVDSQYTFRKMTERTCSVNKTWHDQ
jgi:hypothetical protein